MRSLTGLSGEYVIFDQNAVKMHGNSDFFCGFLVGRMVFLIDLLC